MKTNHAARQIVRIRLALSLLAVVALVAVEVGLGGSLVSRFSQTSAPRSSQQSGGNWAVNFSIPDLAMLGR